MCSCSARDRNLELSHDEIMETMRTARELGCESCTVTGGGEPLMVPRVNEMIRDIKRLGIFIGIVPNGTLLERLETRVLNSITWIRISSSDLLESELGKIGITLEEWLAKIRHTVRRGKRVDWAFSHVICGEPNFALIKRLVRFANDNGFTHVRLVNDIFNADRLEGSMGLVREYLKSNNVDDSRVNYQARSTWTKGTKECYISLLKPVIGADGYWYPCCGTQYALINPTRDYERTMRMSEKRCSDGLREIVENQLYFDGSVCDKCYYDNYNWALKVLLSEIRHLEFV